MEPSAPIALAPVALADGQPALHLEFRDEEFTLASFRRFLEGLAAALGAVDDAGERPPVLVELAAVRLPRDFSWDYLALLTAFLEGTREARQRCGPTQLAVRSAALRSAVAAFVPADVEPPVRVVAALPPHAPRAALAVAAR